MNDKQEILKRELAQKVKDCYAIYDMSMNYRLRHYALDADAINRLFSYRFQATKHDEEMQKENS